MEDGFNYARFYVALKAVCKQCHFDEREYKEDLLLKVTSGRTKSLRELTAEEYDNACRWLEAILKPSRQQLFELRRSRSIVLHQMQKMGVDTSDWERVNALCRDARIAGKAFYLLNQDEREVLAVKLRAISRKGGLRTPMPEAAETVAKIVALR